MSDTQVTFLSDKKLKEMTMKKVKADGITLKALFTMAMRAYIDGKFQVGFVAQDDQFEEIFSDKDIVRKSNELGALLKTL